MKGIEPLITVIIPAFNSKGTLEETVESVLEQTYRRLEILIVDDGSTDGTSRLAHSLAERDERCRYLHQQNAGPASARNRGLEEARGTYVSFLDADDLYDPQKLEKQLKKMEETGGDAVLTGIRRYKAVGSQKVDLGTVSVPDMSDGLGSILRLGNSQMALFTTILTRKENLTHAGKYNPALSTAEDWDLWLRLASFCSFAIIQEPLYLYRKHPKSLTKSQDIVKNLQAQLGILRRAANLFAVPERQVREAERFRYLEHVRMLIWRNELGKALQCLAAGCRESRLYLDRQFHKLCYEILTKKLHIGWKQAC